MKSELCLTCKKNQTALRCKSCNEASCKHCVHFIDEDLFELVSLLPEDLRNSTFCKNCYNQGVAERLSHFTDLAEKAKNVNVFTKVQTKETRRIKRIASPVKVQDCEDREETLLRLAFLAAEKGYDTLVDVDIKSKKVGDGKRYKKLVWIGSGIPVNPSIKK